jgi:hypothetical protein
LEFVTEEERQLGREKSSGKKEQKGREWVTE